MKINEFEHLDGVNMETIRNPRDIRRSVEIFSAVERLRRRVLRVFHLYNYTRVINRIVYFDKIRYTQ